MYQTLTGLGMIVVGSAIILFRERLVRITAALNRFALGVEFPRNWSHGATIFIGSLMSFYGLLILLRLVTIK